MAAIDASRPFRHLWITGREYVTHWAVAGAILALTGFAPDHWFASIFHHFDFPDALRHLPPIDYRLVAVGLGVAIIAGDVLIRHRRNVAVQDTNNAAESLQSKPEPTQIAATTTAAGPPLPDKPSIAVLPFENLSRNPAEDYLCDGITEDIITELSRFTDLFVIARNSSFQYRGKVVEIRTVGRELGVRHILEGSIRRDGGRVCVTAQLVDTSTGGHRWAERYDRELKDLFALQAEVARTLAAILAAHLTKAEAERILLKPPATWQAYEYYIRAADSWTRFLASHNQEHFWVARQNLERSLSIDPGYARAYAMLASTYRVAFLNPMDSQHLEQATLDRAIQLARKAIELDSDLLDAYAELAYTIVRKGDYDAALAAAERAIALNPNFSDYRFAAVFVYVGEFAKAIQIAQTNMRLDPFHSHIAPQWVGHANYLLRNYREALRWLLEAAGRAPNQQYNHVWLAATYAQLGQMEDARREAAEVLRVNPRYTIGAQKRIASYKRSEDMEHLLDGLRKAGLPDR